MRRLNYLLTLVLLPALAYGCGAAQTTETSEEAPVTVEETTVIETTVFRTVMEEPEEPEVEEADAVLGERLTLGGVYVRPFALRDDDTFYFYRDPASTASSVEAGNGKFVFVDYAARYEGDSVEDFVPEGRVSDEVGASYTSLDSEDMPTENSGGREMDSGEGLASTLAFNVPEDFDPERLTVSYGGDESVVDLTERDVSEAEPREYMSVYHLWFNEREYDEIYGLFDPTTTQGISEDEWVSYMDGLWGDWFLAYDTSNLVYEDDSDAQIEVGRSFHEPSGVTTSDLKLQEMVKRDDEWKLIMRQDQVDDVLGISEYVPEESAPVAPTGDLDCSDFSTQAEAQAALLADPSDPDGLDANGDGEACEDTFGPVDEQYVAPTPDPDPDPDPNRPKRPKKPRPNNNGGGNNTPTYPTDGGPGPDKDCSDFSGPVIVSPGDPHDLDADDDGIGCDVN